MKLLYITRALQVILLLFVVNPINANNQTELETCDSLYQLGVNVYLENQWKECIEYFQKAIVLYNKHKEITVNCRIKCQMDVDSMDTMFLYNVENLQFYEKMVKKTLCILKCLQSQIKHVPRGFILSKQSEKLFEQRKPYEFLQLCYYQTNQLQESANSAFTFLVRNPGNEVMLKNLKFYFTLPEVDQEAIVNYESEPYVTMYIHGSDAYSQEDWPAVIANMEESLINYLDSEEKCRAFCEGSFNQGWFPDFTSSISNHFTYCLKCKSKCASNLNTLNGEEHDDLLGSHYHFLQYAYYKIGNLRAACAAVTSYLLFYPNDVTMITNREFYSGMPKVTEEYFTPRPEAIRYVQRMHYEQKLLKFIGEEFRFEEEEDKEIDNEIADESS